MLWAIHANLVLVCFSVHMFTFVFYCLLANTIDDIDSVVSSFEERRRCAVIYVARSICNFSGV